MIGYLKEHSKADGSQLDLLHGTKNKNTKNKEKKTKIKQVHISHHIGLASISEQSDR